MWLMVGLGNPGASYAGHRHSIGFMLADDIAARYRFSAYSHKHQALLAQGEIADQKVILIKPQTFMNLSGQSVGEVARFYKIPPEQVIVFHDELDLNFGKVRIKQGGGHGGHNGLRDVDRHLGQNYWRMRLGIGHPGDKEAVHGYVLSDFSKAERATLMPWLERIAEALPVWFSQGHEACMSKIALAPASAPTTTPSSKPTTAKEPPHGI